MSQFVKFTVSRSLFRTVEIQSHILRVLPIVLEDIARASAVLSRIFSEQKKLRSEFDGELFLTFRQKLTNTLSFNSNNGGRNCPVHISITDTEFVTPDPFPSDRTTSHR